MTDNGEPSKVMVILKDPEARKDILDLSFDIVTLVPGLNMLRLPKVLYKVKRTNDKLTKIQKRLGV